MNILIVSASVNTIGGIQNYNKKLTDELISQGHLIYRHQLKHRGIIAKALFSLVFFVKSIARKPDITLCMHINFSPLPYLAYRVRKRPYALMIYGTEVASITRPLHKKAIEWAHTIVKLFDAAEQDVLRQIPNAAGKMVRIPNSIDKDAFLIKPKSVSIRQKYGLDGKWVILTIARIAKSDGDNKGFMRVLNALPRVLKEIPDALYVLGGGGDNHDTAKARAHQLGIADRLVMPGRIADEELNDFYSLADVFVTPSKNEGFPPIVFLESLASGTPIIGGYQKNTEADDSLWQHDLGIIVDPDNIDAIASAIITVLSGKAPKQLYNPDYLRTTVLEHYGQDNYAQYVRAFIRRFEPTN